MKSTSPIHTSSARRGFVWLVVLLSIVLIALVLAKLAFQYSLVPANHPLASQAKSKLITGAVLVPLVVLAIAGGLGALAYLIAGRSQRWATAAASSVLGLAVAALGSQMVLTFMGPRPAASPATPAPVVAATPTTAQPPDAAPSRLMPERRTRTAQRDALATQARTPDPMTPLAPAASPESASAPPNAVAADAPGLRPEMVAFAREIGEQVRPFVEEAKALDAASRTAPRRDHQAIAARRTQAEDVMRNGARIRDLVSSIHTESIRRTAAMGWPLEDQVRQTHALLRRLGHASQPINVSRIDRFADAVVRECETLERDYDRWSMSPGGSPTSKQPGVRARVEMRRATVTDAAKHVQSALAELERFASDAISLESVAESPAPPTR